MLAAKIMTTILISTERLRMSWGSLKTYARSSEELWRDGKSTGIARSYQIMADISLRQKNYHDALVLGWKANKIYKKLNEPEAEVIVKDMNKIRRIVGDSDFKKVVGESELIDNQGEG